MNEALKEYEIIEKIVQSTKVDNINKHDYIKMLLLHWINEDDLKWIWND